MMAADEAGIRRRYEALAGVVDEQVRRLMLAAETLAIGRGGQAAVARATGVSEATIRRGIQEIQQFELLPNKGRIRRSGRGRKRIVETDSTLREDLEHLVKPISYSIPGSPLRVAYKGARELVEELKDVGHQISSYTMTNLLRQMGYSLRTHQKQNHISQILEFKTQMETGEMSLTEVAKEVGCTRENIRLTCQRYGIAAIRKKLFCSKCGNVRQRGHPKKLCETCAVRAKQPKTTQMWCWECQKFRILTGIERTSYLANKKRLGVVRSRCSECKAKARGYRDLITVLCVVCGAPTQRKRFYVQRCRQKGSERYTCSVKCRVTLIPHRVPTPKRIKESQRQAAINYYWRNREAILAKKRAEYWGHKQMGF
ncbi:hypothetical protein HYV22_04375 [Candidatus Gottesmanbacteria bacterium]|nr:hypothetical protein [Candidatus Gottesmanbacteria bacterium]